MFTFAMIALGLIPAITTVWAVHPSKEAYSPAQKQLFFNISLVLAVIAFGLTIYTITANEAGKRQAARDQKALQDRLEESYKLQYNTQKSLDAAHQENADLLKELRRLEAKAGFDQAQLTLDRCKAPISDTLYQYPNGGRTIRILQYPGIYLNFELNGDFLAAGHDNQSIPEIQVRKYLKCYPYHQNQVHLQPDPLPKEPDDTASAEDTSTHSTGDGAGAFVVFIGFVLFVVWLFSKKKEK